MSVFHFAVLGGGFTGTALAIHLLRGATQPLAITIIDPARELGRGIAYGTTDPTHRINVPSDRMGLFGEDPQGFTRWLFAHGHLPDEGSHDGSGHHYVGRQLYGSFVGETLRDLAERRRGRTTLTHRPARAVEVKPHQGGWTVQLDDGTRVDNDAVALCSGHALPQPPCRIDATAQNHPGLVVNPWAPEALGHIPANASVLIVGTGLTMADVVARFRRNGHAGPLTAVSRRGLLPQPHGAFDRDYDLFEAGPAPRDALSLLRWLRTRAETATPDPGWQVVVDAFRAELPSIWAALPAAEKRRALRRLLPFWEVHRFRIAPQVRSELMAAQAAGDLVVERAALTGLSRDERFQARLLGPGGRDETRSFDAVVLCTGPKKGADVDPLVATLLADGFARPDEIGLGIAVDPASRVHPRSGPAWSSLRAFGPLTRGTFGEMTGAPDITKHMEHVASDWLREIGR